MLKDLRAAISCGDYLASWRDELPGGVSPEEHEWAARLKLEQGDLQAAKHMLERAAALAVDPSKKRVFQMQLVGLEVQSTGNVAQARELASKLMDDDNSDSVVLKAFFLRFELLADMIRLAQPEETRSALRSLIPDLAEVSTYLAATAERWLATTASTTSEALACAERCERYAHRAGFPHLGAEAWIVAAQRARKTLKPTDTILQAIVRAQHGFDATCHLPGLLAVARERTMVRLQAGEAVLEELQELCREAERLRATTLSHSMESDLAILLRDRGRNADARKHEARSTQIAAAAGIGNLFKTDLLVAIESLRGAGNSVAAVRECDRALSEDLPEIVRGLVLQAKARSLSDAKAPDRALETADEAARIFRSLGAEESLSTLADEQALVLSENVKSREAIERSDRLLVETAASDVKAERIHRSLQKAIYRGQLRIHAFNAFRDIAYLDEADERIAEAKEMSDGLPKSVRAAHLASCLQLEANVHASRAQGAEWDGDLEAAARHLANFRDVNDEALSLALAFDRLPAAAGCAMMAGIVGLRAANDAWCALQQAPSQDLAQKQALMDARVQASWAGYDSLARAAELFSTCEDQTMAARARSFQAEICANAAIAPPLGPEEGLTNIAFQHLQEADNLYEMKRAELELLAPSETLAARQGLSQDTERIVALALRILVMQAPDLEAFWEWLQKAKSRSLTDVLAKGRRKAVPITYAEAQAALEAIPGPVALVDWCVTAGQVYLVVVQRGKGPQIDRLGISEDELNERVVAVTSRNYRATLASSPALLDLFQVLIAPLSWMTKPETLLVLCPMAGIGALPLHAIRIDGIPLIVRNPVIIVPNHAVGLEGWSGPSATADAALFGDPTSDLIDGSKVLRTLTARFGTTSINGPDVTISAVQAALATARVIHYHGHASHNRIAPLASALDLAAGPMTAAEVMSGPATPAELVVLGACESGVAQIAPGNEANGLTQAFLLRGAARVISTLWTTPERAANAYVGAFYHQLTVTDVITAHRVAVCSAIEKFGEDRPDLWAPFILSGRLTLEREFSCVN